MINTSTKGSAVVRKLLLIMRCRHISIETKHNKSTDHSTKSTDPSSIWLHLRNTPEFENASTTETATAPTAHQRTALRPHMTARARSSPASRMINQAAPSKL